MVSVEKTQQTDNGIPGLVVDIDRFAVHDGPGIRTAVYLKGCPLRCDWCHSPETQSFYPELLFLPSKCTACGLCLGTCQVNALSPVETHSGCGIAVDWGRCTHCGACAAACFPGALKMSGTWMTAAELLAEVKKERPFFTASGGGVTLSGGEATAQPGFSYQFLAGCRSVGIHTALETNGCTPWRVFQSLLEVVDLFLYDIKHMDAESHRRFTGVTNALPLENLRKLAAQGANVIVRVPCIPGYNDFDANIEATAKYARQVGINTIHLLPYNESAGAKYQWLGRKYSLDKLDGQENEKMETLAEICRSQGLNVQIGG